MSGKGKPEFIDDINDEVLRKGSAAHRGVNSRQSVTAEPFGKSDAEEFRRRLEVHPNVESLVESGKDTAGEDIFGDIKGDVVIEDITGKPDTDVDDGDVEEEKEKKTESAVHKNHGSDNRKKVNPEESLADKLAADSDAEEFRKRLEDDPNVESLVESGKDTSGGAEDGDPFKDDVADVVIEELTAKPDSEDNDNDGGGAEEDEKDVVLQQSGGTPPAICGPNNLPQVVEAFRIGTANEVILISSDGSKNTYYEAKYTYKATTHELSFTDLTELDPKWTQNAVNQTVVNMVRGIGLWFPLGNDLLAVTNQKEDDIDQLIAYKIPATTAAIESINPINRVNVNLYKYKPNEDPDNIMTLFLKFPQEDLHNRIQAIINSPIDSASGLQRRYFVYYYDKLPAGQPLPTGADVKGWNIRRHIIIAKPVSYGSQHEIDWTHDKNSSKDCEIIFSNVTAGFTLSDTYVKSGNNWEFTIIEMFDSQYNISTVSLDQTGVKTIVSAKKGKVGDLFGCAAATATVPPPPTIGPPGGASSGAPPVSPGSGGATGGGVNPVGGNQTSVPGGDTTVSDGGGGGGGTTPHAKPTGPSKKESSKNTLWWILGLLFLFIVLVLICVCCFLMFEPFRGAVLSMLGMKKEPPKGEPVSAAKSMKPIAEEGVGAQPSGGAGPSGEAVPTRSA
ncbi:unnamed protein product [Medioppia subpectinata]|uniref:Uncharacterized protein n=1 Tax=Medioppia subpectinata TaxID=1979941 RepID=A0A7R9LB61_9ACAR|nr:unnamed protein product [Medioppia subpectinata]CAG2117022.1 unnamed protein product [Medioppia subpectinata]